MPPTGAIRAGRAFVELFADDSKLVRGLKRASAKLKAFGASVGQLGRQMTMLGAAALAPLAATMKVFSSMGDDMAKMAKRTGFSVEALSELAFVAKRSGTDIGSMENALRRMQRSIYDAERGLSTAVDGFADLGLTIKDFQGKKPEEQFKILAEQISRIEDPSRKAAIAMTLLGRSGTAMLPMMEQGAAGIEAVMKAGRRMGVTMTTKDAQAAEKFTDAMGDLFTVVKKTAFTVGAALVPSLQAAAQEVVEFAVRIRIWIDENRELVAQYAILIGKTALWVVGIGAALMVVGKLITVIGGLIGALTFLAVHPVVAVLVGLAAVLGVVAYALKRSADETNEMANAAKKLRQEGDRQRQVELDRMDRLRDLARKEKLSNDEMKEARRLTKQLEGGYGTLGIKLDEMASKISVAADSQERLNKAMAVPLIQQLDKEIEELNENMDRNRTKMQSFMATDDPGSILFGRGAIAEVGRNINDMIGQLNELHKRRQALLGGEDWALTGQKPGEDAAPTKFPLLGADGEGSKAKLATFIEKVNRDIAQQRIDQIEDEARRDRERIHDKYRLEERQLRKLGGHEKTLAKLKMLRQGELDASRAKFDKKAADSAKEDEDKKSAQLEAAAGAELAGAYRIERLRLETTKKGLDLKTALLDLEKNIAIEKAEGNSDMIKQIETEFALRKKLAGLSIEGAANIAAVGRGAFGGGGARRIFGGGAGGAAERTAKATEDTAKSVKRIEQKADQGKLVLLP